MSNDVLETLLILDFKARGRVRRFQYATYGPPAPEGGRTIKEYAVRLAPATQAAAGPGCCPSRHPCPSSVWSLLFTFVRVACSSLINPKTRSRNGFAVRLDPLASCDQQAIADVLTHSTLRGPQADTLLLVDIPSARGSHTWTLSTHNALIPSFHFHSAWQHPTQAMWTNSARYRPSSTPAQPTYLSAPVPTLRNFFLLRAAKVRSSCEEGPGRNALQSAYHDPHLDATKFKHNRITLSFRPKIAFKQIIKLNRRRRWQKSVGPKSVQGEDRKNG